MWEIEKIINVAQELQCTGGTGASTGERIAAAFVLNKPQYLPQNYQDIVEAWDYLDDKWQDYIRLIKRNNMHLIQAE